MLSIELLSPHTVAEIRLWTWQLMVPESESTVVPLLNAGEGEALCTPLDYNYVKAYFCVYQSFYVCAKKKRPYEQTSQFVNMVCFVCKFRVFKKRLLLFTQRQRLVIEGLPNICTMVAGI